MTPRSVVRAALVAALLSARAAPAHAQDQGATATSGAAGGAAGAVGQRVEGALGKAAGASAGGPGQGAVASVLGWLSRTNSTAIQGGRLAQQNAASAEVKHLAGRVVTDHTLLEQEVTRVAQARGIQLPGAPAGQAASGARGTSRAGADAGLSALESLKGGAFDQAFLKWL